MKKLIYPTVVLMVGFMIMGCSGMTAAQRKEESDLRTSVGNKPFVGDSSPQAKNLAKVQMYGH